MSRLEHRDDPGTTKKGRERKGKRPKELGGTAVRPKVVFSSNALHAMKLRGIAKKDVAVAVSNDKSPWFDTESGNSVTHMGDVRIVTRPGDNGEIVVLITIRVDEINDSVRGKTRANESKQEAEFSNDAMHAMKPGAMAKRDVTTAVLNEKRRFDAETGNGVTQTSSAMGRMERSESSRFSREAEVQNQEPIKKAGKTSAKQEIVFSSDALHAMKLRGLTKKDVATAVLKEKSRFDVKTGLSVSDMGDVRIVTQSESNGRIVILTTIRLHEILGNAV